MRLSSFISSIIGNNFNKKITIEHINLLIFYINSIINLVQVAGTTVGHPAVFIFRWAYSSMVASWLVKAFHIPRFALTGCALV